MINDSIAVLKPGASLSPTPTSNTVVAKSIQSNLAERLTNIQALFETSDIKTTEFKDAIKAKMRARSTIFSAKQDIDVEIDYMMD